MNFFDEFEKTSFEQWKSEAEKVLRGKPFEQLFTSTYEGFTIKPIYTKEDLSKQFEKEFPGIPYFARSWKIDGNRTKPWKIIQRIETAEPEKANKIIKNEIEKGTDGFLIKHFGFDFKNSNGVILNSIDDFQELFEGVDLTKVQIHFETILPIELSQFFVAFLEKNSIPKEKIFGSIHDISFTENLQNGNLFERDYYFNQIFAKHFEICQTHLPNYKTFIVDGRIFFESGANTIQELALTLNFAVELLKGILENGIAIERVLEKIIFKISVGSDIFFNLAKIRALRLLWAKIVEEFGLKIDKLSIPVFATTAKRNKTKLDEYVNMLRNTGEVFAAILATADFIEVTPYNYFTAKTDEFSYRNARNTQLVLKDEHNLTEVIDPAGGSWFLESLTLEIATRSLEFFKEIEREGGFFQNLVKSQIQSLIDEMRNKRLNKLARREEVLVGANRFPNPDDKSKENEIQNVDYQTIFNHRYSGNFYNVKVETGILDVINFAKNNGLISALINISPKEKHLLKVEPLKIFRDSEIFEELRAKAKTYRQKFGTLPKVLLIPFGKVSEYRDRTDFSNDFFQVGGFDVVVPNGFQTIEEAFQKFYEVQPQIVVFCSSNEKYPEFVPQLSTLIKKAKPLTINVLAGLPPEPEMQIYKTAGVDEFIHIKSNLVETINGFFKLLLGI